MNQRHWRIKTREVQTSNLDESNFLGIAAETLSAAHKPIFPYNSMRISTHPAANLTISQNRIIIKDNNNNKSRYSSLQINQKETKPLNERKARIQELNYKTQSILRHPYIQVIRHSEHCLKSYVLYQGDPKML